MASIRRRGIALCRRAFSGRPVRHPTHEYLITFDAPGAGTGAFQGTDAPAINPEGAITGFYFDSGNVFHGYVRARDGSFITFDAPGAQSTGGESINPAGTITGLYSDTSGLAHGFVRAPDGAITTFDAPGASSTFARNINPAGTVAGYYIDASNVNHAPEEFVDHPHEFVGARPDEVISLSCENAFPI